MRKIITLSRDRVLSEYLVAGRRRVFDIVQISPVQGKIIEGERLEAEVGKPLRVLFGTEVLLEGDDVAMADVEPSASDWEIVRAYREGDLPK